MKNEDSPRDDNPNNTPNNIQRHPLAIPAREVAGGKPAKTGGDVDAAAKERPEEAPFAALRPHDYRLRTWSRRPAAKPTRPNKKNSKKNYDGDTYDVEMEMGKKFEPDGNNQKKRIFLQLKID